MKPFLGIDITQDRKNETPNDEEFVVARVSQAQSAALDRAEEQAEDLLEKAQLPLPIRIGQWISGAIAVLGICGIFSGDVSFSQVYQNVPWLYWTTGIGLVIWVILKLISRKKETTVLDGDQGVHCASKLDTVSANIFTEFQVPANADTVDVLMFWYKQKDGQPVARNSGLSVTPYLNLEFKAYMQDGRLYLVNLEKKYAFDKTELRGIRTVKKKISVPAWNKDIGPKEGIYKSYKMNVDNYARIHFKPYHILEVEHNNQIWGIYFPSYERPVFEKLTGLTAQ